jgi:THO complex subunit 4
VIAARLEYDRSGRSNGTATVHFAERRDAVAVSDRFHNIPLDGLPMRITVIETPRRAIRGPAQTEPDEVERWDHDKYQTGAHHRGRRGNDRRPEQSRSSRNLSAEMLDNDLDSYMMEKD